MPDDERLDRMWNNDVLLVCGGPRVGRLAYVQLITTGPAVTPTHYPSIPVQDRMTLALAASAIVRRR